jgi:uncharacterized protein
MQLAVIGGTGRIGSKVVEEGLTRGHPVTLVARDPSRQLPRPNLRFAAIDVTSDPELAELLRGHDAVVSAFSPERGHPRLYDEYLRGARSILAGTKAAEVSRLLFVGGAGSLLAGPGLHHVDAPEFPSEFRASGLAAREALRLFERERELAWTYLAPPHEVTDGPRTALYRVGRDTAVAGAHGRSYISASDLAVAILDELERPKHLRERFTVGY